MKQKLLHIIMNFKFTNSPKVTFSRIKLTLQNDKLATFHKPVIFLAEITITINYAKLVMHIHSIHKTLRFKCIDSHFQKGSPGVGPRHPFPPTV